MTAQSKVQKPIRQRSYLLRVWQEDEHSPWRASLQSIATGERKGFGTLEAMVEFLKAEGSRSGPCSSCDT